MLAKGTIIAVKELPILDIFKGAGLQPQKSGSGYEVCCPLHGERTPSLKINTSRNFWKCFGCGEGGSGIDFIMKHKRLDFEGAVRDIAGAHNIRIKEKERELTPEEKETASKKEGMRMITHKLQEFFTSALMADTAEAKAAREYAYGRWGETFCKEAGIGYAPKSSAEQINYLRGAGVDLTLAEELGYIITDEKNGNKYAQMRERVMIPVNDRYGRTVAFSGRYFGDKGHAKYKNSKTSLIYQKSKLLFGIDTAIRAARESNYFIMVEGGPDVLRMQQIGMLQAVAPLGTALTWEHLDTLRKGSLNIKFIPDSDAVKEGELYGAGVKGVMKNGRMALEKGFDVTIKEIPRTAEDDANGVKHDADSFITSKEVWNKMEEEPFVVWYARKRFKKAFGQSLQLEVMNDVAGLLIHIQDELTREMCIDQLCKIYGKVKNWRDAMRKAGRKVREEANTPDSLDGFTEREISLLRSLSIIIKDGCYQSPDKDGNLTRWSNFVFRPVLHIKDANKSTRILEVINQEGDRDVIEFSSADFVSLRSFRTRLIDRGNYVWRSEDSSSLTAIQEYIFGVSTTANKIESMGWDERGRLFAMANGIWADGHFMKADTLGVVNHGAQKYFLPALSDLYRDNLADYSFERMFKHEGGGSSTLHDFSAGIAKVYGDGGKIGLTWTIAAMFRDIIFSQLRCFPMLNLFGRKGSGKTELAVALASFFYVLKKTPSSCTNTSIPTIAYMLQHAINSVVILDEFTNDLKTERIDILKGIWGGTSRSIMNTDDKRPVTIPVLSGVILAGQYKPEDEAIFSRCLHLQYSKTVFTSQEQYDFDRLLEMVLSGNSHLLFEILGHRRVIENGFEGAYKLTMADINAKAVDMQIEARIQKNWAIPLTVYRLLEAHLDLPWSYSEIFEIYLSAMKFQNDQASKTSETAEFWQYLDSMHSTGRAKERAHFIIKLHTKFRPLGAVEATEFVEPKRIIYLNFAAVRDLIEKRATKRNGNTLNVATLESYLKSLPQFLGRKQQRFTITRQNGDLDVTIHSEEGQTTAYSNTTTQKAMCFDYDSLKESLDLDLETLRLTGAAADGWDEDE